MKAYTDLEQSKRLAEILPIESADMWWELDKNCSIEAYNLVPLIRYSTNERKELFEKDKELIPCWSLSALLNILDYPQLSKDKIGDEKVGWMVSVYPDNCRYDSIWYDNPIDACYEMILKLHGLKML